MMNYAIVLSGGTGSRMGLDIPKQYYKVAGKMLLQYTLETLDHCDGIDGYVIVAATEWQEEIIRAIEGTTKFIGFALPGENRQLSIYSGLLALKNRAKEEDVVLIQDAARPNTSLKLMESCLALSKDEDGRMPVLPMKDTVYLSEDGHFVHALLDRKQIFAGQAPESFLYGKYCRANEALLPEQIYAINGSSEPAILAGLNITMISGEEENYKITTQQDLNRFMKNF